MRMGNSPHEQETSNVGLVLCTVVSAHPQVEGGSQEREAGLVKQAAKQVQPAPVVVSTSVLQHHIQPHPHGCHGP